VTNPLNLLPRSRIGGAEPPHPTYTHRMYRDNFTFLYLVRNTMGTESFPGVMRPGRGVDHPPPFSAELKERVKLYLYSPSGPSWPVLG
jgi:hypothetical protein